MHVCMYACMHVCMYACMHVCMYVCMYVCMCVCMYLYIYIYIFICICVHTYVYIYIYIYIYICTHAYTHCVSTISSRQYEARQYEARGSSQLEGGGERGRVGEWEGRRAECGLGVMGTPRASLDTGESKTTRFDVMLHPRLNGGNMCHNPDFLGFSKNKQWFLRDSWDLMF